MSKNIRFPRVTDFFSNWWTVVFGLGYVLIVSAGAMIEQTPTLAIDECKNIVAMCEEINTEKTLGTKDKFNYAASKPTFNNYSSFTYEVLEWGAVATSSTQFAVLANETMNDPKGWVQAGFSFSQVPSGGDFSLVITEASILDTIAGCSSVWSCRTGRYVIINQDRWDGATTAWNDAGGSLRDYRHMVVNHELGHWLGHGHSQCSGAGNLAYVMQQQSIALGGCKTNPWPLLLEIQQL